MATATKTKVKEIASYRHRTEPVYLDVVETASGPDETWRERHCFYVSVRDRNANDGSRDRYALVLGPFRHHQDAIDMIESARVKAEELDPRSWFYAFGTCQAHDGSRDGVLNQAMGFEPH